MKGTRTRILPFESLGVDELTYVIIGARFFNSWLFVRHRERQSWELPAGHIERGEQPDHAAARELQEETGATDFKLEGVCDYRVEGPDGSGAGRLYLAWVKKLSGRLEHEITEIRKAQELPGKATYPEVQEVLFNELKKHYFCSLKD